MKNILNKSVREMRKQDVIDCFYNSFKEVRKNKPYATQNDIIKYAVNCKAPRFYVTFDELLIARIASELIDICISSSKFAPSGI